MPTKPIWQVSLTGDRIHQFRCLKSRMEREVGHDLSNQQAMYVCFRAFADSDMTESVAKLNGWTDRRRSAQGETAK